MLILILPVCAGAALGWLRNGRVHGLSGLRWRAPGLIAAAVAAQLLLRWVPSGARLTVVVVSYITVGAWVALNVRGRRLAMSSALALVAVGWAMNVAATVPNGGMPVSSEALSQIGVGTGYDVRDGHLFKHVPDDGSASLAWLGDTIPVPALRAVISLGDIVMAAGIVLLMSSAMVEAAPRRRLQIAGVTA